MPYYNQYFADRGYEIALLTAVSPQKQSKPADFFGVVIRDCLTALNAGEKALCDVSFTHVHGSTFGDCYLPIAEFPELIGTHATSAPHTNIASLSGNEYSTHNMDREWTKCFKLQF